jgi:hypothetical protein
MARITRMTLRRLENNFASFDVIKVLRTHWTDMPCFATVMTICSFHPFKERKHALASIDDIVSTVLVTGRKLMGGIGGVFMLAIHANALSFLCSKELKVLDFQIIKNEDKLLAKGGGLHYLLEVGVVHHCGLGLANLTEFVGGCSGHPIDDMSDNV